MRAYSTTGEKEEVGGKIEGEKGRQKERERERGRGREREGDQSLFASYIVRISGLRFINKGGTGTLGRNRKYGEYLWGGLFYSEEKVPFLCYFRQHYTVNPASLLDYAGFDLRFEEGEA